MTNATFLQCFLTYQKLSIRFPTRISCLLLPTSVSQAVSMNGSKVTSLGDHNVLFSMVCHPSLPKSARESHKAPFWGLYSSLFIKTIFATCSCQIQPLSSYMLMTYCSLRVLSVLMIWYCFRKTSTLLPRLYTIWVCG